MIHVCSLARLHETVEGTGARHVVSLLGEEDRILRPAGVSAQNHLWLQLHDITLPMDGYISPQTEHVERLVGFVRSWDRSAPIVMHCYAGISRSTAAAFVSVCALNPGRDELMIARALRRASPTALPNSRIVALADCLLRREGRMVAAIDAIGRGIPAGEGQPFRLDLE
ncbi:MAG: protein tyrosine phosphatase [Bradyrhizobiaceae bacterium]|nr:protein tyrosine phosphatase [Bradyrhizobiaceae bacterium]